MSTYELERETETLRETIHAMSDRQLVAALPMNALVKFQEALVKEVNESLDGEDFAKWVSATIDGDEDGLQKLRDTLKDCRSRVIEWQRNDLERAVFEDRQGM